MKHIIIGS